MKVHHMTPILNVSDIHASFAWFNRLGWEKGWEWGDPVGFGGVCCDKCEIFLCEGGQGGRGRGENNRTFDVPASESADKGVWMSWWVDDVDEFHQHCVQNDIEVTWPPTDMPWNVREMHIRHPDGHVFRVGKSIGE